MPETRLQKCRDAYQTTTLEPGAYTFTTLDGRTYSVRIENPPPAHDAGSCQICDWRRRLFGVTR